MGEYEQVLVIYKKINPSKKFTMFTYYEYESFDEIFHIERDHIIKINDDYYIFACEKKIYWNMRKQNKIIFKNKAKIIHEHMKGDK